MQQHNYKKENITKPFSVKELNTGKKTKKTMAHIAQNTNMNLLYVSHTGLCKSLDMCKEMMWSKDAITNNEIKSSKL